MSGFDAAFKVLLITSETKLRLEDNHLVVISDKNEAKIYIKDIYLIILDVPFITLTSALLSRCANEKIIILSSDKSHIINGIYTPFMGHFLSAGVIDRQILVKQKTKAMLWQKIVKNKIFNQSNVLEILNFKEHERLKRYAKNVKLNDGSNLEATSASLYFKTLFGKNFRRDDINFYNLALNYGYSIIRSAIIRAVCISGLLPSFGIFHKNDFNGFNLCDDLIEPFRAFVDLKVFNLKSNEAFLKKEHKKDLIEILDFRVLIDNEKLPLNRAIIRYVQNFKRSLLDNEELLKVKFING